MWPIPVRQFLQYGIFLKDKGLAVRSISGCFSALAFAGKALGYIKDRSGIFRVWKMLKG